MKNEEVNVWANFRGIKVGVAKARWWIGWSMRLVKEHFYPTVSVNFILYLRRNHKNCSSRCDLLNSGTISWIAEPEQGSKLHRQLLVPSFDILMETITKRRSPKVETFGEVDWDKIIWDPLDLNWQWAEQMKIQV